MCDKKKVGWGIGLGLVGVGVAIGAYAAKKYFDRRKALLKNYDVEVDRLQNEVDFDYSEDFLKELKKETLQSDKKHYTKEDVKNVVKENTEAIKAQVAKLENVLKEYLKKSDTDTDTENCDGETESVQVIMDGFDADAVATDEDFEPEEIEKEDE